MATNGGPNIIEDGLVFAVDAANKKSYLGSGTTWTDLAGSNNGTLTNGPTFDSGNGGSIVFDGTDDYVDFAGDVDVPDYISLSAFIKLDANASGQNMVAGSHTTGDLQFQFKTTSNYLVFILWTAAAPTTAQIIHTNTVPYQINNGTWYHYCATYDGTDAKIYIDGSLILTNTLATGGVINNGTGVLDLLVGARNSASPSAMFYGDIAYLQIYNKALTAAEITQNYNALKSRFGL